MNSIDNCSSPRARHSLSSITARLFAIGLTACATVRPTPPAEIPGLPYWARICVKSHRIVDELLNAADSAVERDDCKTALSIREQIEKLRACTRMNCLLAWEEYKDGELSSKQVDAIGAIGNSISEHWTRTRDAIGRKCGT